MCWIRYIISFQAVGALSPSEAQGHREDGELYAFFARQHAERCDPDALARVLGLDEGALSGQGTAQ